MTSLLLTVALVTSLHAAPQTQAAAPAPAKEVIAEVRIHGNQVVADDEVLRLAGITIGDPFTETTMAEVKTRLEKSGKFESVEVLKRFASIDDPSRITVVIIASEGAVRIVDPLVPGGDPTVATRGVWGGLMFMPLLDFEDGYGVTFGARVAYPHPIGPRSRLSFPLTWGGLKRAGVELDRTFASGALSRVEVGAAIQQRTNPAYEEDDTRRRVWGRAEKAVGPLRVAGTGGWQHVSFAELEDDVTSIGAEVAYDTRLDPVLPRNALFVSASIDRLFFDEGDPINRTRVDARGYVGVFRQQVVILRVQHENASAPAPPYLRSLLGGWSNLRGFEPGFMTGDSMVAGSIEWRSPITSPLSVGKLGISLFADWGTAWDKGQRFADQPLYNGLGGGVWFSLTAFRLSLAVAHGRGAGTRFTFAGGLTF